MLHIDHWKTTKTIFGGTQNKGANDDADDVLLLLKASDSVPIMATVAMVGSDRTVGCFYCYRNHIGCQVKVNQ